MTGNLTKNFSRHEFECQHCGRAVIVMRLVEALQELRDRIGKHIYVLSGYRCPIHNTAIGGSDRSRHLTGEAADIAVEGWTPRNLYAEAEKIPAFNEGGLAMYADGHVHVDVRLNGPARWGRV